MQMQKTMIYLPKQVKERVMIIANAQRTSQADVIRKALEEGLGAARFQSNASAEGLIKIGQLAEKFQAKGPSDLSKNLDHYTWDE